MKTRLALVLLFVLGFVSGPSAQAGPTIGPNDALGFDYLDTDMSTAQVNNFQVQWDGGPWVNLGVPVSVILADTATGAKTYKVIPSFTSGSHTMTIHACNSAGCGVASSPFPFVVGVAPNGPTNVRKIPR